MTDSVLGECPWGKTDLLWVVRQLSEERLQRAIESATQLSMSLVAAVSASADLHHTDMRTRPNARADTSDEALVRWNRDSCRTEIAYDLQLSIAQQPRAGDAGLRLL